ncbi:uncharacterized protein LOC122640612 [Telopea speciosissima]|uniref:uncharacterized protein LOC122640612 n=1 Tax=Telopea speciosissima TaxID=54955 RepID=UPI001CC642A4|nr:uncharacterized protein LOC122640612 [Telopea speciosissima]
MRPPSLHSGFFSSLKQVEKRLKSEDSSHLTNHCSSSSTDHLGSPIFLNCDHTNNSSNLQDSDPPQDFLSHSLDFPPTQKEPSQLDIKQQNQTVDEVEDNKDDIERLIELLDLSELRLEEDDGKEGEKRLVNGTSGSCFCHGGFYSKIAGVKGPKCEKEMERLDGWIKYLLNDGGGDDRSEPLSLVYLLLGRAACASQDADGLEGLEFPSTIEEFLQNDPPK